MRKKPACQREDLTLGVMRLGCLGFFRGMIRRKTIPTHPHARKKKPGRNFGPVHSLREIWDLWCTGVPSSSSFFILWPLQPLRL